MVDRFEAWVCSYQDWLTTNGVSVEFVKREVAVAILETPEFVSSITVWDIGACDIDMVSVETGISFFAQRYDFDSFDQILPVLEDMRWRIVRSPKTN